MRLKRTSQPKKPDMKRLDHISLSPNQLQALDEVRRRLSHDFDVEAILLYGSVVRGESDEESDLDLLILTTKPLTRTARHKITDAVFEVNLHHGTNLSTLVVDRSAWDSGPVSVLPIRDEILKEGIPL
ncbi:MAG: nucleotidyltransferase domain-containing protein [Anaerolineae bacterium]